MHLLTYGLCGTLMNQHDERRLRKTRRSKEYCRTSLNQNHSCRLFMRVSKKQGNPVSKFTIPVELVRREAATPLVICPRQTSSLQQFACRGTTLLRRAATELLGHWMGNDASKLRPSNEFPTQPCALVETRREMFDIISFEFSGLE